MTSARIFVAILCGCWLAQGVGCGAPPQLEPGSRRLIESLRTAISARNQQWLVENAKLIEERHRAGVLDDTAHAALKAILSEAQAGNWRRAETDVVELAKAQQPLSERPTLPKAVAKSH